LTNPLNSTPGRSPIQRTLSVLRRLSISLIRHPCGLVLSGWLATLVLNLVFLRVAQPFFPTADSIGPAQFVPLVFFVCIFVHLFSRDGWPRAFWISLGGLASVLFFLTVRKGASSYAFTCVDMPVLIASVLCLVVALIAALTTVRSGAKEAPESCHHPVLFPNSFPAVIMVAAGCVLLYRASFSLQKGIPNDERSIFVHGVEIHHMIPGLLVLALVGVLSFRRPLWRRIWPFAAVVYALAAGTYLDQIGYAMLAEMSDKAYGGSQSLSSAVVALGLWFVFGVRYLKSTYSVPQHAINRPLHLQPGGRAIIGHRGACGLVPENTLESVQRAIALGLDIVEVDVARSADGELFLMHDWKVDRTTDGKGRTSRLSWSYLAGLKIRDRTKGKNRTREEEETEETKLRIPKLGEVFRATADESTTVFVDVKGTKGAQDSLAATIREQNAGSRALLDFESCYEASEMKAKYPDLPVVISPKLPFLAAETAVASGADGVDISYWFLCGGLLRTLAKHEMIRTCWFTSNPRIAERVLARSVDGLMSNHPDRLLKPRTAPPEQEATTM
jgi:glycerophosphoryl diester phosphodiesterase